MRELIDLVRSSSDEGIVIFGRRAAVLVLRVAPAIALAAWMIACGGSGGWAAGWYLVEALP